MWSRTMGFRGFSRFRCGPEIGMKGPRLGHGHGPEMGEGFLGLPWYQS